jgi:hypothetical protein
MEEDSASSYTQDLEMYVNMSEIFSPSTSLSSIPRSTSTAESASVGDFRGADQEDDGILQPDDGMITNTEGSNIGETNPATNNGGAVSNNVAVNGSNTNETAHPYNPTWSGRTDGLSTDFMNGHSDVSNDAGDWPPRLDSLLSILEMAIAVTNGLVEDAEGHGSCCWARPPSREGYNDDCS